MEEGWIHSHFVNNEEQRQDIDWYIRTLLGLRMSERLLHSESEIRW